MIEHLEKLDARIPAWGMGNLTRRDCPFCGGENEAALVRPDGLPVAFCLRCGCWYVAKLPSASDIQKLYESYYHHQHPANLSLRRAPRILANAGTAGQADWQLQVLAQLLEGLAGKRVFDVGCGWGRFLVAARAAGADVVGCDLSPQACAFAERGLGIAVHQSDLLSCATTVGSVDAVVMRDFIEHPAQPLAEVRAAHQILKPGGLLLLHTPNGGEAGTDIRAAKQWLGFRVDLEHLQYLSPHTVNRLAQRFGMNIERLQAFGFPEVVGVDTSCKEPSRTAERVRDMAKRIPGAGTMVRAWRAAWLEISAKDGDTRRGSYHLFAILRKR